MTGSWKRRQPGTPTPRTEVGLGEARVLERTSPMSNALYDRDFYAWTLGQAALLRAGRLLAIAEACKLTSAQVLDPALLPP